MDGQCTAYSDWSTSDQVNPGKVSPKVGCFPCGKHLTLVQRGRKLTFSKVHTFYFYLFVGNVKISEWYFKIFNIYISWKCHLCLHARCLTSHTCVWCQGHERWIVMMIWLHCWPIFSYICSVLRRCIRRKVQWNRVLSRLFKSGVSPRYAV